MQVGWDCIQVHVFAICAPYTTVLSSDSCPRGASKTPSLTTPKLQCHALAQDCRCITLHIIAFRSILSHSVRFGFLGKRHDIRSWTIYRRKNKILVLVSKNLKHGTSCYIVLYLALLNLLRYLGLLATYILLLSMSSLRKCGLLRRMRCRLPSSDVMYLEGIFISYIGKVEPINGSKSCSLPELPRSFNLIKLPKGTCSCCQGQVAPKVSAGQNIKKCIETSSIHIMPYTLQAKTDAKLLWHPFLDITDITHLHCSSMCTPCWMCWPKWSAGHHGWRMHALANLRAWEACAWRCLHCEHVMWELDHWQSLALTGFCSKASKKAKDPVISWVAASSSTWARAKTLKKGGRGLIVQPWQLLPHHQKECWRILWTYFQQSTKTFKSKWISQLEWNITGVMRQVEEAIPLSIN